MDWIIQSKDEISGRTGENRYETKAGFLAALRDIFGDPKKRFVGAALQDGKALDEAAARALVPGFTIGTGRIGEDPV
jgi:hypothetical protein